MAAAREAAEARASSQAGSRAGSQAGSRPGSYRCACALRNLQGQLCGASCRPPKCCCQAWPGHTCMALSTGSAVSSSSARLAQQVSLRAAAQGTRLSCIQQYFSDIHVQMRLGMCCSAAPAVPCTQASAAWQRAQCHPGRAAAIQPQSWHWSAPSPQLDIWECAETATPCIQVPADRQRAQRAPGRAAAPQPQGRAQLRHQLCPAAPRAGAEHRPFRLRRQPPSHTCR